MTPQVVAAFSRELSKLAAGKVLHRQLDDGAANALLGAGAVSLAGAVGSYGGERLTGVAGNLHQRAIDAAAERDWIPVRDAQTAAAMRGESMSNAANSLPNNVRRPSLEGLSMSPAERDVLRAELAAAGKGDLRILTNRAQLPQELQHAGSHHFRGISGADPHIFIDTASKHNAATLAHEVGHATGWQGLAHIDKSRLSSFGLKMTPRLAAAGTLGSLIGNPDDATRDKNLKITRNLALASGALHLPQLVEEARANIRAVNMGRKVGRGLEYAKQMLPAYGTYVAKPVAVTGATALGVEGLRRYLKSRGTKTQREKQ